MTIPSRAKRNHVTSCDHCHTHFTSARYLVTHLYYNPSHVTSVPLAGREADASYRSVGR